jgi:hypothetical protein
MGFYDHNGYKKIPKNIRQCNEKIICTTLRGYFDADGTVERHGVSATTNSKILSIQLKSILLNLGIRTKTRIRKIIPPGHNKPNNYYEIIIQSTYDIKLFRKFIGFKIKYKQNALNKLCDKQESAKNDVVPNLKEPLKKLVAYIRKDRGYLFKGRRVGLRDNINRWIRGKRRARRDCVKSLLKYLIKYKNIDAYKQIEKLIDIHLLYEPIKTLSKKYEWTCDFYIPDGHSFITNGLISHNSFLCMQVGYNVASINIPVLYLDTELTRKDQMIRLAAQITNLDITHIETGGFASDIKGQEAIDEATTKIEALPLTHCSIAGQSVQTVLAKCRRWLIKTVGLNGDGTAKPCLIIYDYLKLMNSKDIKSNLAEFQILGFLLTEFHNFSVKYMLPIFSTVQLNRDGVEKEGSEVFAGSDRLLWLCSSATILKRKTSEELNEDPPSNGDKKLIVTDTRFGPGSEPGDYINLQTDFATGRIKEGGLFSQSDNIIPMNLPEMPPA